ncbi:MAG: cation diffusion facilitator family transporter [Promethearchaeota archaeon]|jgi:cobalt-zinc-cadmium efflux system protein
METKKEKSSYTDHLFQFRSVERKRLILSLIITLSVMIVEIIGGIVTNSIALLSDAGHMFTHAFAISISLLANMISKRPASHHKTFGLYRAEVLAAFINGLFLIPIVGIIIFEAILRFLNPQEIFGFYMLIVAFIGLAVNITSILILQSTHKTSLNVKSVFYHMIADAASSIGIVVVAFIIMSTGIVILDPLVSLGISAVILYWSWGILRDSTRILLEMTPKGMNIEAINEDLKNNFPQIIEVDDAHLWTIIPGMLLYSAHIRLKEDSIESNHQDLILSLNEFLSTKYKILESTIQILPKDAIQSCNF